MLSFIIWDPAREMFPWNLPFLGRPILWYGFFFAFGFFLAYFFLVYLLKNYFYQDPFCKKKAKDISERALVYSIIGTVIGARLGDIIFYQNWHALLKDPFLFFKIWEGGLASHGGAIGVLIAFWLLFRKIRKEASQLSFLNFLDIVCIPILIVATLIRVGNFFNQEILGVCTTFPLAVIFAHPADGSFPCPRHPAQLYEAFCYLCTFGFLVYLWKKDPTFQRQGRIFGWFLVLVFGFRMLIECIKVEQSVWLQNSSITMGQWLSIPFVLVGLFLLLKRNN